MNIPAFRLDFTEEDIQTIQTDIGEVLRSGMLTYGPVVEKFEHDFSQIVGSPHAIAVNHGTGALEVLLRAYGLQGVDVLVPTNTFIATPIAVEAAGCRPVFVDCERADLNMSLADVQRKRTKDTKAVMVVHIGGQVMQDFGALRDWCRAEGLLLLEDAAHAHGASWHGEMAGNLADGAGFSFFPTKVVTSAEGGMITTSNPEINERARLIRSFGRPDILRNDCEVLGGNWRMSEPHGVIGRVHLRKLHHNMARRTTIAERYQAGLSGADWAEVIVPSVGIVSSYYKCSVLLSFERDAFKAALAERGVHCPGEVYRTPCHRQDAYLGRFADVSCPVAEAVCAQHLCLPIYPDLTEAEVDYVLEQFHAVAALGLPVAG